MPDKRQGTACQMREKMLRRYDDDLHHKHDKNHFSYRKHCKSHPVQSSQTLKNGNINEPTGMIRIIKLRKLRKRLDKGLIH